MNSIVRKTDLHESHYSDVPHPKAITVVTHPKAIIVAFSI